MSKSTTQSLEARIQAKEAELRRDAKLAAIAEDPESILDLSIGDIWKALGTDSEMITVRQLIDIVRPHKQLIHAGNGARLAGEAREQVKRTILELLDHYGGLGCRDLATMISIPSRRVGAMLKQMRDDDLICSQGQKVATVYFLPPPETPEEDLAPPS